MNITLSGYKFSFRNIVEFVSIYKDIFILREYSVTIKKTHPLIIDCGSHIGLSILYFKKKFPKSKVLGFEANPNTFEMLKKNVFQNKLKDVTLVHAAVSTQKGRIPFYVSKGKLEGWAWGDSGVKNAWYSPKNYKKIMVPSVKLSSFIKGRVDLLKIDVEGMEHMVIFEIRKKLHLIDTLIMEFHGSKVNRENSLRETLKILEKNKFSYNLYYPRTLLMPFRRRIFEKDIKKEKTYFLIVHATRGKASS